MKNFEYTILETFPSNCKICTFKQTIFGICSDCIKYLTPMYIPRYRYISGMKLISLGKYISRLRESILDFKFKRKRSNILEYIVNIFYYPKLISTISEYDAITYIPMTKRKIRGRRI